MKWPNDVWVDGRKVAGVLVEGRPQEGWAVLGIGVNVALDIAALPAGAPRPPPGRWAGGARTASRSSPSCWPRSTPACRSPPRGTVTALRARDALRGRTVRWDGGEGVAGGIDDAGRLIVGDQRLDARRGASRVMSVDLPNGRITIPEGVVRRQFGDDKVLLNLATGHYHGLNPTGGYMVALLEETGDAEQTATPDGGGARRRRSSRVREDLAQLCAALLERGLIVID